MVSKILEKQEQDDLSKNPVQECTLSFFFSRKVVSSDFIEWGAKNMHRPKQNVKQEFEIDDGV